MAEPLIQRIGALAVVGLIAAGCSGSDTTEEPIPTTIATTTTQAALETTTTQSTTTTSATISPTLEIAGTPLPAFEPQNEVAVGLTAPEISGAAFDGTPTAITHDGQNYKMILFLAHWCSHCQDEVPEVREWMAEYDLGENIKVLSVSTGERQDRGNWPPDEWLEREQWTVPVIEDSLEADIATSYGLTAFPYWVFLDKDGSVLLRTNGLSADALTQIADQIKAFDEDGAT